MSVSRRPRSTQAQRARSLQLGNAVRLAGVELRSELADGTIELVDALDDPRARSMPIYKLLSAQFGWGPHRTGKLLVKARMSYAREVGSITTPRKRELVELVRESR